MRLRIAGRKALNRWVGCQASSQELQLQALPTSISTSRRHPCLRRFLPSTTLASPPSHFDTPPEPSHLRCAGLIVVRQPQASLHLLSAPRPLADPSAVWSSPTPTSPSRSCNVATSSVPTRSRPSTTTPIARTPKYPSPHRATHTRPSFPSRTDLTTKTPPDVANLRSAQHRGLQRTEDEGETTSSKLYSRMVQGLGSFCIESDYS